MRAGRQHGPDFRPSGVFSICWLLLLQCPMGLQRGQPCCQKPHTHPHLRKHHCAHEQRTTHTHTHIHTHTHTHTHTLTHTRIHSLTFTDSHTHTHSLSPSLSLVHRPTHTHACTHTTYAHTHSSTHTHCEGQKSVRCPARMEPLTTERVPIQVARS